MKNFFSDLGEVVRYVVIAFFAFCIIVLLIKWGLLLWKLIEVWSK